MILVWDNIKSFQQHLEDMKVFRQSHHEFRESELTIFKHMPTPHDIDFPFCAGGGRQLIKNDRKTIIVPIWRIEPAQDSQN